MGRPATLKVDIVTDSRSVNRGIGQAEGRLSRLGGVAKRVGKVAAIGLGVAAAGAVAFAGQSVQAASDVQQAYGGVDSVFGRSAKAVKKWADNGARSVGLAKSDYASLATIVGSQLKNMGRSTQQAAGQTHDLIGLGADLSATFGGSVSDAVSAVSSLLKGERDPIERYGVSIKQSDINARLASQGLSGLTGKALTQAQATAALTLLTEQTSAAHGQFARESDTLAHQQQVLGARFTNVKAAIGAKLLPVVTRLFVWLNDKLLPGAKRLGAQLQAKFGPALVKIGAFISGRVVPAARQFYRWYIDKIVPAIKAFVLPILSGLRSAFHSVSASVNGNSGNLSKLGRFLRTVIPPAAKILARVLGGGLKVALVILGHEIGFVIGLLSRMVGAVVAVVNAVKKLVSITKSVGGVLGKLNPFGAAGLVTAVPPLVGRSAGVSRTTGGLATASGGFTPAELASLAGGGGGAAVVYVDRRSFTAKVEGAVSDPVGAARQIERLLRDHAARTGGRPTFTRAGAA